MEGSCHYRVTDSDKSHSGTSEYVGPLARNIKKVMKKTSIQLMKKKYMFFISSPTVQFDRHIYTLIQVSGWHETLTAYGQVKRIYII